MRKTQFAAAALLLACTAFDVKAQEPLSDFDRGRLERLSEARANALDELMDGSPADRAAVDEALGPQGRPISARELTGNWRCRVMKIGGLAPARVYAWYPCRVRQAEDGLYFEKRGGQLRIAGYIEEGPLGMVLLAAHSVGNGPYARYSGGHRGGAGAITSSGDEVGVISGIGAGHVRIELPYPLIESTFDVIELRR
jgi:hypothetical protein